MMPRKKLSTMVIRAPRDIVKEWEMKFPGVNHSQMIRVMWNTSLLKIESGLRNVKKK